MSFRLTTLAGTSSLFSGPCRTAEDSAESSLMKRIFFFCGPFSGPLSAESHMPCRQVPIMSSSFSVQQLSLQCTENICWTSSSSLPSFYMPNQLSGVTSSIKSSTHRTILELSQTADFCPMNKLFLMKCVNKCSPYDQSFSTRTGAEYLCSACSEKKSRPLEMYWLLS